MVLLGWESQEPGLGLFILSCRNQGKCPKIWRKCCRVRERFPKSEVDAQKSREEVPKPGLKCPKPWEDAPKSFRKLPQIPQESPQVPSGIPPLPSGDKGPFMPYPPTAGSVAIFTKIPRKSRDLGLKHLLWGRGWQRPGRANLGSPGNPGIPKIKKNLGRGAPWAAWGRQQYPENQENASKSLKNVPKTQEAAPRTRMPAPKSDTNAPNPRKKPQNLRKSPPNSELGDPRIESCPSKPPV